MKSLNWRKLKLARLQTVAHAPGLGQIGPAIDANSGKVLGIAELYYYDGGVLFRCKGCEMYIPGGNIINMVLEPEEEYPVAEMKIKK
jgi:hypothetical protein